MSNPLHPDIIYQIFPDRFCNGQPDLTPKPGAWSWKGRPIEVSDDPTTLTMSPQSQYTFFGGDLDGIRSRLDFLADLGVTTIYLNPIFAAHSVHRYDAIDYHRIDSALGSRGDFEALADALHERGMKLFLDGVLNHTSKDHPWYQDPESRQRLYIMKPGGETMTWMNHGSLPKLDTQCPDVQRRLLDVLDAWPEADGWRLDAAHLLPQDFLREIRTRVHPRPVIIEDWNHGVHYIAKGLADGITNFQFREAARTFFVEDASPETLLERLAASFLMFPDDGAHRSWIFLENHDLPRFMHEVGRDRMMRALVLLFTCPGTPLIYQGGEFGMNGKNEAESRAPINWDETTWDHEILALTKKLIALRQAHPALWRGSFNPLLADNRSRTFAFERVDETTSDRVIVAMNDGYQPCHVELDQWQGELSPGQWRVEPSSGG